MNKHFSTLGWLEGASLLILLFIAMPLKYILGAPMMVRVVGSAHGFLFVAYCLAAVWMTTEKDWPFKTLIQCWVLSCLPFGTFYFDKKLMPSR